MFGFSSLKDEIYESAKIYLQSGYTQPEAGERLFSMYPRYKEFVRQGLQFVYSMQSNEGFLGNTDRSILGFNGTRYSFSQQDMTWYKVIGGKRVEDIPSPLGDVLTTYKFSGGHITMDDLKNIAKEYRENTGDTVSVTELFRFILRVDPYCMRTY